MTDRLIVIRGYIKSTITRLLVICVDFINKRKNIIKVLKVLLVNLIHFTILVLKYLQQMQIFKSPQATPRL